MVSDEEHSARESPEDMFEGYLSVIITGINMTALRRQNMLMCNEWFVFRIFGSPIVKLIVGQLWYTFVCEFDAGQMQAMR